MFKPIQLDLYLPLEYIFEFNSCISKVSTRKALNIFVGKWTYQILIWIYIPSNELNSAVLQQMSGYLNLLRDQVKGAFSDNRSTHQATQADISLQPPPPLSFYPLISFPPNLGIKCTKVARGFVQTRFLLLDIRSTHCVSILLTRQMWFPWRPLWVNTPPHQYQVICPLLPC